MLQHAATVQTAELIVCLHCTVKSLCRLAGSCSGAEASCSAQTVFAKDGLIMQNLDVRKWTWPDTSHPQQPYSQHHAWWCSTLRAISSAPGLGIVMLCVGCAGYILCTHRGIMPDVLNDQDSWRRAYEHSPNDTRTGNKVGRATLIIQLLETPTGLSPVAEHYLL
jgi:hypothetical protein